MAEETGIAWCDSTFNPVIGCTKVGPGCDNCYAAEQDSRKRWDGGKTHWGAGVPRYRTSEASWREPLRWNAKQRDLRQQGDVPPWRVFCASLADVFDNEWPAGGREDLWRLIEATPYLSWLLVTKRIGNVAGMVPRGWIGKGFPPNIRLLITVCNQEEADRDIPKLLAMPCKNGISYEPALGPIFFSPWLYKGARTDHAGVDWIIVGGESGSKARPFDLAWARSTIEQGKAAGVPVFVKQCGSEPYDSSAIHLPVDALFIHERAGADPAEWPESLRVREFPA